MRKASLGRIFWVFLFIGATTIGGGYAIIPQVFSATEKRRWVSVGEFHEILATAQLVPGAVGINAPILVGFKLRGFCGALAALAGIVLPPFILILLASNFLPELENFPIVQNVMAAIRPAVAGLIFAAAWKVWKQKSPALWEWIFLIVVFLLLVLFKIGSVPVIGLGLVLGFLMKRMEKEPV